MSSVRSKLAYAGATFACALVGTPPAAALTTIGQLAPGTSPLAFCTHGPFDILQPTVTSGNSYVVPAGGAAITSWSTNAAAGTGQTLEMKVFRKVGDPATYMVVGHDGPHALIPSMINTFTTNIAVQPGDVLGLNDLNAVANNNACEFSAPGDSAPFGPGTGGGNLADGQSGDFSNATPDERVNATAVVGFKPSNADSLGNVKLNKNNGTATLAVNVPGPGTLTLKGSGVKTQRPARDATASKTVSAAGTVKLLVKAKGKAKKRLNKTGKVKVKVSVVYTPSGTGGDVAGDPNTQTKSVKLVKKR